MTPVRRHKNKYKKHKHKDESAPGDISMGTLYWNYTHFQFAFYYIVLSLMWLLIAFILNKYNCVDPDVPTEPHEKKHKKQKRHEDDKSERKKRKKEKKRKKQRHTPEREQPSVAGSYMNPGTSSSGLFGNTGHMPFSMPF